MDPELEFQLQCEAQEKRKKSAESVTATSLADASGTYTDPQDGTVYEWDTTRKAWFPKIDSDFLAMYQASYGVPTDAAAAASRPVSSSGPAAAAARPDKPRRPISDFDDEDIEFDLQRMAKKSGKGDTKRQKKIEEKVPLSAEEKAKAKLEKKKKAAEPPSWFEVNEEHNRNVYVSNLPTDITEEELLEFMSKTGIIMKDPRTDHYKIKLYRNSDGSIKGDALCTYMKIESVPLALQILDGYQLRTKTVKVERAKFNLKGEFDVQKAKLQKLKKNEKKRQEKAEAKLLDWRPDKLPGDRPKNEKVVVIKNMFDTKEFEDDPSLILEFKKDLQSECEGFGEVKKVVIYDRHPEGIATIGFADFDPAAACIAKMNGRFFAGRQLSAAIWDGKTKYKVEESEEEEQKRLGNWEDYLGGSAAAAAAGSQQSVPSETNQPPT